MLTKISFQREPYLANADRTDYFTNNWDICFHYNMPESKKENLKSSESAQEENHFDFPDSLSARIISFVPNLKRAFPKNTKADNSYAQ